MNLDNYDNYVFDLYGTLIDINTDERAAKTWKKWLKILDRKKIRHPDYIRFRRDFFELDKLYRAEAAQKTGSKYPEIEILNVYRELFDDYGNKPVVDEKLSELSYAFRACSREYYRLYDGVPEFLKKLRSSGKKVYILSNAQASYTLPEILHFGLDKMVDDCIISSDYGYMKPDGAFFEVLIGRHSLERSRTVMIGDSSFSDGGVAKNCGTDFIHLADENSSKIFYIKNL
ncbi:MAG: HAD family hydrolase [Lachnospiraceae bacterium]|nr:HAD family hydrolase [Lachnospiraceae bacterium]